MLLVACKLFFCHCCLAPSRLQFPVVCCFFAALYIYLPVPPIPAVPKVTKIHADAPNVRVFTDTTGIIKGPDGTALKMFGGTTVFQFFVDDATRRVKVYPMQRKTEDEFLRTLKQYITEVGQPMVILRSDGAAEFQSDECKRFYEEHRIKREITPADTPQYNGVLERANPVSV